MSFDKYFKGTKGSFVRAGKALNQAIVIQSDGHAGVATVFGNDEKAESNTRLFIQSKPMTSLLYGIVMSRRKKKEAGTISEIELAELNEAERILKLILK